MKIPFWILVTAEGLLMFNTAVYCVVILESRSPAVQINLGARDMWWRFFCFEKASNDSQLPAHFILINAFESFRNCLLFCFVYFYFFELFYLINDINLKQRMWISHYQWHKVALKLMIYYLPKSHKSNLNKTNEMVDSINVGKSSQLGKHFSGDCITLLEHVITVRTSCFDIDFVS